MATDIPESSRKAVYERDGRRCRWCGRTNGIFEVHHIVYRSAGVDHRPANLILLCKLHHQLVHTNKRHYPPLLFELLARGPGITGLQLEKRHEMGTSRLDQRPVRRTDTRSD